MSKILAPSAPLALLVALIALPCRAEPAAPHDCEARAARVVAQLAREAGRPLPPEEDALARKAALAGCDDAPAVASARAPDPRGVETSVAAEAPEAAASGAGLGRLVSALLAMEPRPAKTRPGGKYRYLERLERE